VIRVEFHAHTIYSKDSLTPPEDLIAAAKKRGIDRLIITEHNNIAGALAAQAIDPDFVIVGEEVMTRQGELLAAFVKEEVPPGLPAMEALQRLRDQGAFISVSHPFDVVRKGHWKLLDLLEIVPYVDAIETFKARCLWPGFNRQAQEFARQHNLPGTAGSDAHTVYEIGRATLLMPEFNDPDSLRAALPQAKRLGGLSNPFVHFASIYAKWYKRRQKKLTGQKSISQG